MSTAISQRAIRGELASATLAACCFLMLPAAPTVAATRTVTNCNDSGAGSLRAAVAAAASGDTIDARALGCASVRLASRVAIPQANLTIVGPGMRELTIDANRADRLFLHTGTGTLRLKGMTLAYGRRFVQTALGGCIRSLGNVALKSVHLHYCQAEGRRPPDDDGVGTGAFAGGGAIHADGNVSMESSQIHDSVASTFTGYGGGVAARSLTMYASRLSANNAHDGGGASVRNFQATYSVIDHNDATQYGGVRVAGDAFVLRSTISDNAAYDVCGGLCVDGRARIVASTISRNMSGVGSAGAFSGMVEIYNSTIAGNLDYYEPTPAGCGTVITRLGEAYALHIESSVVAGNRCRDGNLALDVDAALASASDPGDTITGSRNLIGTSNHPLPADTIHANPRLGALANNGGATPTMKPAIDSPVIDRGSNALFLDYDQRGPGYPRTQGVRTDIGAFER